MYAGYQIFTPVLAIILDTPFVQGCLYHIALKPFVHKGYSNRTFKKPLLRLCCTKVVPFYSGFLAVVVKQQVF
jgi:hypothetical protein